MARNYPAAFTGSSEQKYTVTAEHLDYWLMNWWAQRKILCELRKSQEAGLNQDLLPNDWQKGDFFFFSRASNYRWVLILGITSRRGRPIYNSDRDLESCCQRLTNNNYNWGYRFLQGFSFSFVWDWNHASIIQLLICISNEVLICISHLHPPSKTNYFLFIMEGLGMVVLTFFVLKCILEITEA